VLIVFLLSLKLVVFGFIWWFESRNYRKQMEDFEKQPERWNEFLRTGDDYHFLKKDKKQ
jgi:hypothetical protein